MSTMGSEVKKENEKVQALSIEQQKELLEATKVCREQKCEQKALSLINTYAKLLADKTNQAFTMTLMATIIDANAKLTLKALLDIISLKDIEKAFTAHYNKTPMQYALDAYISATIIRILNDHGADTTDIEEIEEIVQARLYQESEGENPSLDGMSGSSSFAAQFSRNENSTNVGTTLNLEGMPLSETSAGGLESESSSQQLSHFFQEDAFAQTSATWSLNGFAHTEASGFRSLNNNGDLTDHPAEQSYDLSLLPMFTATTMASLMVIHQDLAAEQASIAAFDSPLF